MFEGADAAVIKFYICVQRDTCPFLHYWVMKFVCIYYTMEFNNASYILRAAVGDLDFFILNILCRFLVQGSCLSKKHSKNREFTHVDDVRSQRMQHYNINKSSNYLVHVVIRLPAILNDMLYRNISNKEVFSTSETT